MLGPTMESEQFNPMLVEVKSIFVVKRLADYSGRSWSRYLELTDSKGFFIFHPDLKEFRRFDRSKSSQSIEEEECPRRSWTLLLAQIMPVLVSRKSARIS
jgi:hypothetical protein